MEITNNICIGLMSGTSLDGLDIVAAVIDEKLSRFQYKIIASSTVQYPDSISSTLAKATSLSGYELTQLDHHLGQFFGNSVNRFVEEKQIDKSTVRLIASHGHTVFHQPDKGFTLQIGHGADIAAQTKCKVINDFRIEDVVNGGQGAPLVPIGDRLLFSDFDACINLGGFSNISFEYQNKRIAFDICPCNLPLNRLAQQWEYSYDKNGTIAKSGVVNDTLLKQLQHLPYYQKPAPKSLGVEWLQDVFEKNFSYQKSPDLMRTLTEHIALQISDVINKNQLQNVLFSGGGTHNSFLMQCIRERTHANIHIPDDQTIDYKEALVFAFLGWLKDEKKNNVLSSVTGSNSDGCYGITYLPPV